eukprot:NODE_8_length_66115_cov_0.981823.p1 type:complete len:1761 gc:universal NODE_8_length_66115_cov_0.981823:12928-18210(+)
MIYFLFNNLLIAMKHILLNDQLQIVDEGTGIIDGELVTCPTQKQFPGFKQKAKYNPQSLPYFINGPFPIEVTFPHFKNNYHTLDDIYVLYGQFESHRFYNKELYLPAADKPSTGEDKLFHGYTIQSFLSFIHTLSELPFTLVLLPEVKIENEKEDEVNHEFPLEQGLVSSSNVIFVTWPDTVESMNAFLMGLCWHVAGITFGYFIRCPLARNPYVKLDAKNDEKHVEATVPLIEYQLNHLWVIVGLRGYLYIKLLKQIFGPSFVQYYTFKSIEMILEIEEAGNIPSVAEFYVKRVNGSHVVNNLDCTTAHRYFVSKCTLIMYGLSKRVGDQAMDQFTSNLLKKCSKFDKKQNNPDDLASSERSIYDAFEESKTNNFTSFLHTLNSNEFIKKLQKLTTYNFQDYLKQYIFYPGLPILEISYQYNKRKGAIEIDISQSKTIPGGPIFTGPLAIKIQEPDGSYEHVLDVQKQVQQFEVRYNTRYKRVKRFRNVDTEDVMFHRDINSIVVSEYAKPEDEAMEYLRVDCDNLWIGRIVLQQSEYMIAQMVLKEVDVRTQIQGIKVLKASKEPPAATVLFRILCNHRFHPLVRSEAAFALKEHHLLGMYYLLQYIKRFWCENDNVDPFNSPHTILNYSLFIHGNELGVKLELEVKKPQLYKYLFFTPLVLKLNDFCNFGQYTVAVSAIQALSMIRIDRKQITIPAIRENSLGMSSAIAQRLNAVQNQNFNRAETTQQAGINSLQSNLASPLQSPPNLLSYQHQQLQAYHQQMSLQTMSVLELPSMLEGVAPPLIRKLSIDMLKLSDNRSNQFHDDDYLASLVNAIYNAFIPKLQPDAADDSENIDNEEIIGDHIHHANFLEIVDIVGKAYRGKHDLASIHPPHIDYHLFKRAIFQVDSVRVRFEGKLRYSKTVSACIKFLSHSMLLDLLDVDLSRILPHTLSTNHILVRLQSFESLMLLNAFEYKSFLNYFLMTLCSDKDLELKESLAQMLISFSRILVFQNGKEEYSHGIYKILKTDVSKQLPLFVYLDDYFNKYEFMHLIQQVLTCNISNTMKKNINEVKQLVCEPRNIITSDLDLQKDVVPAPQIKKLKIKLSSNIVNKVEKEHESVRKAHIYITELRTHPKSGFLLAPADEVNFFSVESELKGKSEVDIVDFVSKIRGLFFKYLDHYKGSDTYSDIFIIYKDFELRVLVINRIGLKMDPFNVEMLKTILIACYENHLPLDFKALFRQVDDESLKIGPLKDLIFELPPADLEKIQPVIDQYNLSDIQNELISLAELNEDESDKPMVNQVLLDIWNSLNDHDRSLCFREPIDPVALGIPDYFNVIKQPMDLQTIYTRLNNNEYGEVTKFRDDVILMLQNCYTFNSPGIQVYQDANTLESFFRQKWLSYYPQIPVPRLASEKVVHKPIPKDSLVTSAMQQTLCSDFNVRQVLNNLKKRKEAALFLKPVDPVALNIPTYPEIVKNPMDFQTINDKIGNDEYEYLSEFVEDVELVFSNCWLFNPPGSYIHGAAIELKKQLKIELSRSNLSSKPKKVQSVPKPAIDISVVDDMNDLEIGILEIQVIESAIRKEMAKKAAIPFLEPVDVVRLNIPQYKTIIKTPMDFSTLLKKLNGGYYQILSQFFENLFLIFENCYTFNTTNHPVSVLAKQIEQGCVKARVSIVQNIIKRHEKLKATTYEESGKSDIYKSISKLSYPLSEMEQIYETVSDDHENLFEIRCKIFEYAKDKQHRFNIIKAFDNVAKELSGIDSKKRKKADSDPKRKKSKY